ncbi:uncharacterized protein LY89DRAFT_738885 [Mollisia scopiformis]|uniref:Uncharacterized protein n=1 Tax=Mollisia scopiformis TaxID=149040 RepID=A0A194WU17_MOLSC|nr:uncharacterized protein LY89DRAFT_738885 [Mollisia scopiformis]KUJ11450.1 hypothetical protein LY89DRAFT_738885 [Mollisia scopiformis]
MASSLHKAEDKSFALSIRSRSDLDEDGKITLEPVKADSQNASNSASVAQGSPQNTMTTPTPEPTTTVNSNSCSSAPTQDFKEFRRGSRTPQSVMTPEQREAYSLSKKARREEFKAAHANRPPIQRPQRSQQHFRDRLAQRDFEREQQAREKQVQSTHSTPDVQDSGVDSGTNAGESNG